MASGKARVLLAGVTGEQATDSAAGVWLNSNGRDCAQDDGHRRTASGEITVWCSGHKPHLLQRHTLPLLALKQTVTCITPPWNPSISSKQPRDWTNFPRVFRCPCTLCRTYWLRVCASRRETQMQSGSDVSISPRTRTVDHAAATCLFRISPAIVRGLLPNVLPHRLGESPPCSRQP